MPADDTCRSEGQFYVVDMETGEKFPGLNLQEAQAKWSELGKAIYMQMDHYKKGRAPLSQQFDGGKVP